MNKFSFPLFILSLILFQFFVFPSKIEASSSRIYVANSEDNTISVIDESTGNILVAIPVGGTPRGIAEYSDRVYVGNADTGDVSVISKLTNDVIATVPVSGDPLYLIVTHDGAKLYVSGHSDNTVTVIDTTTNIVERTLTGFSVTEGLAISPDDKFLYVINRTCCSTNGYISVLETIDYTEVMTIPLEIEPAYISLSSDGFKAYISDDGGSTQGDSLSVINLNTNIIINTIPVGVNPRVQTINSIGTRLYVSSTHYWAGDSFGTVSVIDTSTDSVVATIPVGNTPNFLAISPDDKRVYVANTGSDTVSVIDTATNTVVDTIPVGSGPWGIVVSELTTLSVPYFSQNALPWGPTEYDSTKSLGTFAETMDRWGCAITSIAMVMKYQQIDTLPNGDALNPGSLNEWLKANNGYIKGYGPGGWYSFIDWSKIGTLSKKIFDQGLSEKKLEWKRLAATEQNLTNELENDRPPVLQVRNAATSMHFAVATGIQGDTFILNDPEWEYPDLTSFNNTFYQVDTFIPSLTNLSYITMYINPEVEILVTDPLGRKTGKQVINGIMQTYNEIPEALYGSEGPISNPNSEGDIEELGTGGNSFILPKPLAGLYTITLSSKEETFYTVNISATEADGDSSLKMLQGSVFPGQNDMNAITYSQDESSEIKKTVTFASTLEDIKELRELDFLHISKSLSLTALIKNAEKAYQRGDEKLAEKLIDLAIKQIEKSTTEFVDPIAKEILMLDFIQLKEMVTE